MNRKFLVVLVILIACASFATLGCAGKSPKPMPTAVPSITPTASSATATPGPTASAVPGASVTATSSAQPGDTLNIDPSLLNLSGEGDESLPEHDIPTPDAGN